MNNLILTRENGSNVDPVKIDTTFGTRLMAFVEHVGKAYGSGDFLVDQEWEYLRYVAGIIVRFQQDTANDEDKLYFQNLSK